MKKKTMKAWFWTLFILGLIVGYLLPGTIFGLVSGPLKADVIDIPKAFGQLEYTGPYTKFSKLVDINTASIELLRLDDRIPKHVHRSENHFAYIHKGSVILTIGTQPEQVHQGQMIVMPAGVPHSIERIGDVPVEIMLFASPSEGEDDVLMLESDEKEESE